MAMSFLFLQCLLTAHIQPPHPNTKSETWLWKFLFGTQRLVFNAENAQWFAHTPLFVPKPTMPLPLEMPQKDSRLWTAKALN